MWKPYAKDNHPRPGQMVIVIGRDVSKQIPPLQYFRRFQSVAQYQGSGKLILKEPVYPWETKITHWMPLPIYPEDSRWYRFVNFFKRLFQKKLNARTD